VRRLGLGAGTFLVALWIISGNSWLDIDVASAQYSSTPADKFTKPGQLAPALNDTRVRGLFGTGHIQPNDNGSLNVVPLNQTGSAAGGAYTCPTASGTLLPQAPRQMLAIDNESSSANIAISFGGTAALNTAGSWTIPAGMTRSWSGPFVPSDAVNCITSGGSGTPVTIQVR
jgi:hypothetical protein